LGVGDTENRRFPTQIKTLNFQSCHILQAGDLHSAFLNDKNELFVWGNNEFGQLGLGSEESVVLTPEMVDTQAISEQASQYFEGQNSIYN
jgi:alpha-tubulin suppressor-like RCC1 family protein